MNQTVNPNATPDVNTAPITENNSPEIDLKLDANQLQNNETGNENTSPNVNLNTDINNLGQNSQAAIETTPEQTVSQNTTPVPNTNPIPTPELNNNQQAPMTPTMPSETLNEPVQAANVDNNVEATANTAMPKTNPVIPEPINFAEEIAPIQGSINSATTEK